MHARKVVASSLMLFLVALPALADQKIKTKSNIKNDRIASTCGDRCEDAGKAWAAENKVATPADCESSSPAFTKGCQDHLKAQAGKAQTR
jgi:hypothetical protein